MHKPSYIIVTDSPYHRVRCKCGEVSPNLLSRHEAEDYFNRHREEMERLRVRLGREPSMKSQRDYYQEQADRYDLPEKDREQWQMLADGLSHRLGDTGPPRDEQLRLL